MNDIVTQKPKNLDNRNRFFNDNAKSLNKFDHGKAEAAAEQPERKERGTYSCGTKVKTV